MANTSIIDLRKKEGRGFLLTSLIILGAIAKFYYFPKSLNDLHDNGIGGNLFVVGDAIVFWIILYFIWNWSKKSVYALFIYFGLYVCFFLCLQLIISPSTTNTGDFWFLFVIFALIASLVWFLVLKRKFHLFK
jgi:hypothetical protein